MTTKQRKSGDKSAPATLEVSSAKAVDPTRAVGEGVSAVWVHLDALKPNPRNPRLHGAEKLLLARTILRTRWGAPVLVQRSTMRIIGGHGRREAALEIMAGIEVDGFLRGGAEHLLDPDAPGPGMVPCRILDCSDAEADALTLADNARRLQGRDDPAALVAMASHAFTRDAPTMLDMGFGGADLDALVKQGGDALMAGAPTSGEAVGDNAAEWEGMPEFESQDKTARRSITVHFASDEDVAAFGELIGTTAFGNNSTWFPPRDKDDPSRDVGRFSDRAYVPSDGGH